MKSIMQEASSVTKAIEMGWQKAGKPKEFSVKVFEEPQKNFFGITTRSAKIGIFFEEETIKKQEPVKAKHVQQVKQHAEQKSFNKPKEQIKTQEKLVQEKQVPEKKQIEDKPKKIHTASPWTQEMKENVNQWLIQTLKKINLDSHEYSIELNNFCLLIKFNKQIFPEEVRQRQFFSSLSSLFLQMLKRKFKRPLKGYKIIIQSS